MSAQKYKSSPDTLVREVDDGAVLLDLKEGVYFGLDEVGLLVWQLLTNGSSFLDVCENLHHKYDASEDQIAKDVSKLIEDLLAHGLLVDVREKEK